MGETAFPVDALQRAAVGDIGALLRGARSRGVEPRLVTGYDSGGTVAVTWYIPDTGVLVFEGTATEPA